MISAQMREAMAQAESEVKSDLERVKHGSVCVEYFVKDGEIVDWTVGKRSRSFYRKKDP